MDFDEGLQDILKNIRFKETTDPGDIVLIVADEPFAAPIDPARPSTY